MLDKLAPEPGKGWACLQCGLAPNGAVVVVCNQCLDAQKPYEFAVSGYPAEDKRVPFWTLSGNHQHDMSRHLDET